MKFKPQVSVIIPCYNSAKYIGEAIDSVIGQTFNDWECIIVNDGSTDDSQRIIKEYTKIDSRIKILNIPQSGSPDIARNAGVNIAKSDIVIGLDSDDFFSKDCIEKMFALFIESEADIVYQRMIFFRQEPTNIRYTIPIREFNMNQVISGKEACSLTIGGWNIGFNGGMIRKQIYCSIEPEELFISEEHTLRKRLLLAKKVAFCDTNYYMRLHNESTTHKISTKIWTRLTNDYRLEKTINNNYDETSGIPSVMRKERLMNLIYHQVYFSLMKKKFDKKDRLYIISLIRSNYLNQNFTFLKKELPIHWLITFLTSFEIFQLGCIFYYKLKPHKFANYFDD